MATKPLKACLLLLIYVIFVSTRQINVLPPETFDIGSCNTDIWNDYNTGTFTTNCGNNDDNCCQFGGIISIDTFYLQSIVFNTTSVYNITLQFCVKTYGILAISSAKLDIKYSFNNNPEISQMIGFTQYGSNLLVLYAGYVCITEYLSNDFSNREYVSLMFESGGLGIGVSMIIDNITVNGQIFTDNPTLNTQSPTTAIPSTLGPSITPTYIPSINPTISPVTPIPTTADPSPTPTQTPTMTPSLSTDSPTINPSLFPSNSPTLEPTMIPSNFPSIYPSETPTLIPTMMPTCGININDLKVWYKGGLNDITNNGYNAININGSIYQDLDDCGIYGDTETSFVIPYNIQTLSHTIIYIAKYNGHNKERILTSTIDTDYLAGFYDGNEGVCYQGGWITQQNTGSNNDWIIMVSYPGGCRANGKNVTINNAQIWSEASDPITFNIGINVWDNTERSDWKLYELMIYDTILSEDEISCIEKYLSQEH